MPGILDKKVKFIDLVVTQEGRRQMAQGGFRPSFASFSDKNAVYDSTNSSILPVSESLCFQTPSDMPDDQIVYESDDAGNLFVGLPDGSYSIVGNDVFKRDYSTSGSVNFDHAKESDFSSTVELVRANTVDSFKRNKFIRTWTGIRTDPKEFKTDIEEHTFVVSNSVPFPRLPKNAEININATETFMFDNKLTHHKNFQYLPPVNKDGSSYGVYQDLRSTTKETFADIKRQLGITIVPESDFIEEEDVVYNYSGDFKVKNRAPNTSTETFISREYARINFTNSHGASNIIAQVFEEDPTEGTVKKLDIVDAGMFLDETDPERPEKHVFYLGKIMFDSYNVPSFINIFTMIMD